MDTSWRTRVWRICSAALVVAASGCASVPRAEREEGACYGELKDAGVGFERVPRARALGVEWPIKLTGPIDGIKIYGGKKDAPTNYLDCRLALALIEWAPLLKREGVVGLQHYSMYRHEARIGKSSRASGHAHGRAIDIGYFDMSDGSRLSVLHDWKNRARGVEVCTASSKNRAERLMRELVCEATEREVFQMVLTPHYNNAHKNHVHLEVGAPNTDSWIG